MNKYQEALDRQKNNVKKLRDKEFVEYRDDFAILQELIEEHTKLKTILEEYNVSNNNIREILLAGNMATKYGISLDEDKVDRFCKGYKAVVEPILEALGEAFQNLGSYLSENKDVKDNVINIVLEELTKSTQLKEVINLCKGFINVSKNGGLYCISSFCDIKFITQEQHDLLKKVLYE